QLHSVIQPTPAWAGGLFVKRGSGHPGVRSRAEKQAKKQTGRPTRVDLPASEGPEDQRFRRCGRNLHGQA
ncbi:MAG TPA: hypothetical protein VFY35_04210, partial [Burkholderiaceae bacterium]|nr:hypothetical protein [Burkholderiaceae bacterium]